MALFPIREDEIINLGKSIIKGLEENKKVFPAPPVSSKELLESLARAVAAQEAAEKARAAAEHATANKKAAMQELSEKMRWDLRYAENTAAMNHDKLRLLGWGKPRRGRPPKLPGQVRSLEVSRKGEDWVRLDWKEPVDGGMVLHYRVERRDNPDDLIWAVAATSTQTIITLEAQEPGTTWEYRIVAVNKAGDGEPSSTVIVNL